jgi:hypothetical protein
MKKWRCGSKSEKEVYALFMDYCILVKYTLRMNMVRAEGRKK